MRAARGGCRHRLSAVCLVGGWGVIGFGLHGLVADSSTRASLGSLRTLVLLNVANDAVAVPAAVALGWLLRRLLPAWTLAGAQVGLLASAVVLAYSYPLLGDWGHGTRAGYSRLPWDYGWHVGEVLAAVWVVSGVLMAWARRRRRRASGGGDHRSPAPTPGATA